VVWDEGGAEARRFGATTSGHAVLYSPDGRLLFRGGLTGARGHAGDNANLDALAAVLDGAPSPHINVPVFGCPLFELPSTTEGACNVCKQG
jgi:hypothetical protein